MPGQFVVTLDRESSESEYVALASKNFGLKIVETRTPEPHFSIPIQGLKLVFCSEVSHFRKEVSILT